MTTALAGKGTSTDPFAPTPVVAAGFSRLFLVRNPQPPHILSLPSKILIALGPPNVKIANHDGQFRQLGADASRL